jgi:hypothetical protein
MTDEQAETHLRVVVPIEEDEYSDILNNQVDKYKKS